MTANIDETVFEARLAALSASYADHASLIEELERFVRTAPDDAIVRINPLRYAVDHQRDDGEIIDLFLHARKAGLLIMEWLYVCRVCGMVVESFHALNTAGEHFFCKMCIADRDADLSEYVEIGFSVSRAVRRSRFHSPETLPVDEFLSKYNTSSSAFVRDGTSARDFYSRHQLFASYVEPGETKTFELNLDPGFLALTPGPEMLVDSSGEPRDGPLDFTHRDNRPPEEMIVTAPGPLTYRLTNGSDERIVAVSLYFDADEMTKLLAAGPPGVSLGNFLSGARLLATQTFLDLFPTETVMSAGGLAVKHVALLFTDVKGSTALYERVGDMTAFSFVRQHFGILRDVITSNDGALVKTIGDAVMASFHEPLNAIRASLDILTQIRRFNETAGEELLTLKIGAHAGPCIAVTLNERLDYFGRTVNLAARAQSVADANEICLTDTLYNLTGAAELIDAMEHDVKTVHVKGIEREVVLHVLRRSEAPTPTL